MNREQGRLRAGQWVGPVGIREDTTQAHIYTMHTPIVCTCLLHMWTVHIHTFGSFTGRATSPSAPQCAVVQFLRTPWLKWGPPRWEAACCPGCLSIWPALLFPHASIVDVSRPTPSRTALALPAAFLLTYLLKSMRWSGQSAEEQDPSHLWTGRVCGWPHALTSHLLVQCTVSLSGHRGSCGGLRRLRLWLGLWRYRSNHPKSVLGVLHKLQGHKGNVWVHRTSEHKLGMRTHRRSNV